MSTLTKEEFLKDVRDHKATILLDNDLYRHVRFARPGSNCYSFDLITFPGGLLFRGDMGCYEFERIPDMFSFFRQNDIKTNLGYWREKLQAVWCQGSSMAGAAKEFVYEKFMENVDDAIRAYVDGMADLSQDKLFESLKEKVEDHLSDIERDEPMALYRAMMDFELNEERIFEDFYEYTSDEYTHHFQWCCFAIVWGIWQYDTAKANEAKSEKNL